MINNISIDEFLKLSNPTSIIDVRNSQSFNNNHIPNAINIPYEKLLLYPNNYLMYGKTYYIYCQKGIASKKIVSILNKMGYSTINLNGGYEEWVLKR